MVYKLSQDSLASYLRFFDRYITGDLGYLNENGYLTLAGRMKRFVKVVHVPFGVGFPSLTRSMQVAGEMVSLPAVEEALRLRWPNTEDGPVVAVEVGCMRVRSATVRHDGGLYTQALERPGEKTLIVLLSATEAEVTLTEAVAYLTQDAGMSGTWAPNKQIVLDAIPLLGTVQWAVLFGKAMCDALLSQGKNDYRTMKEHIKQRFA